MLQSITPGFLKSSKIEDITGNKFGVSIYALLHQDGKETGKWL
jgi:hypothetical protein